MQAYINDANDSPTVFPSIVRPGEILLNEKGGNVGIGTTNPQAKLHVNGSITQVPVFIEVTWTNPNGDTTLKTNAGYSMNMNFTTINAESGGTWTKSAGVTGNGGWNYVSGATLSTTTPAYSAFAPPVSGYYYISFNIHGFDQNSWGHVYLQLGSATMNFATFAPTGVGYSMRNVSASTIRYLTPSTYVALSVGNNLNFFIHGNYNPGWSPTLNIFKVA